MAPSLALLCVAFSVAHSLSELTPPEIQLTCQPLEQPLCRNVGYMNTSLPNSREHQSQNEAAREMADFEVLWVDDRTMPCSGAVVHFLCSFYFPFCGPGPHGQDAALRPCRDLCEEVRSGCSSLFAEQGVSWPLFLNCSTFPEKPLCFGPADPASLTVPDGELRVASPSPSTLPEPTSRCPPLTRSLSTVTAWLVFALAISLHG